MADPNNSPVKRGPFLRAMYYFYAAYLGVTPPKPEHEKLVAGVVIGFFAGALIVAFLFARYLISSIYSR